jgi:tetratricopeptide (TPR) repeat protein
VLTGACAARAVPPVVTTPRYPDFVFPAVSNLAAPGVLSERLQRGWQFLQGGDLGNAEREFSAALKRSPQAPSLLAALAWVDIARGDTRRALTGFDRLLEREPSYVSALVGRGQALLELDRDGDALASFEAAVKVDPSLTDLQARIDVLRFRATEDLLARATSAVNTGRLADARDAYLQAIAASPDSAFLYRDLAAVERRAGETAEATAHLRRAIELDPTDARAHAALGELLEPGDPAGALAAYETARSLDPSLVAAAVLARVVDRVRALKLPPEYGAIATAAQVTRADVAALIGVRLEALVAQARPQPGVITDIRGHWAQPWITAVVQAGIMDALANYQFDPGAVVRRGDLARTVSRLLALIEALRPEAGRRWQNARIPVADVPPSHLSYPAVSTTVAAGVMALENGAFDLLRPVTGPELSDIVTRLQALAR